MNDRLDNLEEDLVRKIELALRHGWSLDKLIVYVQVYRDLRIGRAAK